jgi:hypothetical protein
MMPEAISRNFDFELEAELYPPRTGKFGRRFRYRRFDSAAEAVQFAIEQLPAAVLAAAFIEVGDDRLDCTQIRRLYDSPGYPLKRSGKPAV